MSEKCEWCGRFGARKLVADKGPNGLGGRQTLTLYLCPKCEEKHTVPEPEKLIWVTPDLAVDPRGGFVRKDPKRK